MFKLHFLIIFLVFCLQSFKLIAQKASNHWYFGNKIGLNFNQNPPSVLSDNSLQSIEGSASISDDNGQLLFYSNGVIVANKAHQTMSNGNNLMGDLSSTNNTVIVPLPGSEDSLYYLFTIGASGQLNSGLRYSIINIKKNDGLGEVIQKNTFLNDNCFEKLAVVRHCNKVDFWITVKDWNSADYYTYLLTKTGITGNPIINNMGTIIDGNFLNSIGTLKFSSDGKKLIALHAFENNVAQLMSFDNNTGTLSNPILFNPNPTITPLSYTGVYGAAFSSDNNLLYISSIKNGSEKSVIYQFDITSGNSTIIENSRYVVSSSNNFEAGALQMGPDGKIYYAQWKNSALSVITNPDIQGAGCNYIPNFINFPANSQAVQFGLPNFVASDLDPNYLPYNFSWNVANCSSLTVQFIPDKTFAVDSIKWTMGDGAMYNSLSPQHTYILPGSYSIIMEVFKNDCGPPSEIITKIITIGNNALTLLPKDTILCTAAIVTLSSTINAANYKWNTGEQTKEIRALNPGLYWLEVSQNGCIFRDSISIALAAPLIVSLGPDKAVCIDKPVMLTAGLASGIATEFLWSNGSTANTININTVGITWVQVKNDNGCIASDTLKTLWGDCDMYIPSAFSPNGDGINETFGLVNGVSSNIFTFYIYNRYGEMVFTTNDPLKKWDGKYKGKPSPNGVYIWMITFKNRDGFIQTDKGTVSLIR